MGARIDPEVARLVNTDAAFAELVEELASEELYGFDTEFHRERTYYPRLALLQVCWPGRIALVDPLAIDVADFAKVLDGPGLAVVHACDQDLEVLRRACGTLPGKMFDTQLTAGFVGMSAPSLGSLTERLLSVHLEKGDQLTDWTRRPLAAEQLRYAANDVAYLLELYEVLSGQLERRGRRAWAEAECELALSRGRGEVVPEEVWWKLRQARQLRGKSRGVAQEVAAWRERRAQELDVPVRSVLPDLALVSIAQRPPKGRRDLEQVRTIDSRHLGGGAAEALLRAVEAGAALSPDRLHLPPLSEGETAARPAAALAAAWVQERARQLEIDPAILATRADVVAYLKSPPSGRLLDSWRHELVGEPLRRLVAGELAVAFEGTSLVLEERTRRPVAKEPATG
ncbi:MAG TPA: HRDC domain-containing protein [Acidimicrobiales bacterium]|nr:HRDC domain-containing protein [Acidimicrobiales bacterium]